MPERIREEGRETEVAGRYDVCVVGGGPAGITAAVAAARSGARTILVERYGFLGGTATAGMVGAFCGFFTAGPAKKPIVSGIAGDLLGRLASREGLSEKLVSRVDPRMAVYQYHPEVLKRVSEEAVMEAGAAILLHTLVVDVLPGDRPGRLGGAVVENRSGRLAIMAKVFVDATGDGELACRAGAPFEMGDDRGRMQAMTTMFRMTGVDMAALRAMDRAALARRLEAARQEGTFSFHRVDPVIGPAVPEGTVSANMTGIPALSAIDAWQLTEAEIEGRRQVFEYLRFLRGNVEGFASARLSSIAAQVGIRETRRILGACVLSESDVLTGTKPADGIALGAWPVEMHDPETGKIVWRFVEGEDDYYSIPMGCLVPRETSNLVTAGRCISVTHVAQASTRVIGQAMATGEAAGTLAAVSAASGLGPAEVPAKKVRAELAARGAALEA